MRDETAKPADCGPSDLEHIKVMFGCATGDLSGISEAVAEFGPQHVEIIAGLETDTAGFRDALKRCEKPTLFVLCKTMALDGDAVRRAVEEFSRGGVRGHRLLVLEFVRARTRKWLESIGRTRESMAAAEQQRRNASMGGTTDGSETPHVAANSGPSVGHSGEDAPWPTDPRHVGVPSAQWWAPTATRRAHLTLVPSVTESHHTDQQRNSSAAQADANAQRLGQTQGPASAENRRRAEEDLGRTLRITRRLAVGGVVIPLAAGVVLAALSVLRAPAPQHATRGTGPEQSETVANVAVTAVSAPGLHQDATTRQDPRLAATQSMMAALPLQLAPINPEALTWPDAMSRCSELGNGNATNFRVPSFAELAQMRSLGHLPAADFWSATSAVARAPSQWIITAQGRQAVRAAKAVAQVACVREVLP